MASGNRDYHYTHWTVQVDRATDQDRDHLGVAQTVLPVPIPEAFFLNQEEEASLRYVLSPLNGLVNYINTYHIPLIPVAFCHV